MEMKKTPGNARRSFSVHVACVPRSRVAMAVVRMAVATALLISLPAIAADPVNDRNQTVDDVVQAFDNLTHHGEWLGFHPGDAPYVEDICSCVEVPIPPLPGGIIPPIIPIPHPDWCMPDPYACTPGSCDPTREQHFQGIARSPRVGRPPILYVIRAGDPDSWM